MANMHTFLYIKEHELNAEDILNLLNIPHSKEKLERTFEGRKVIIKGLTTDYTIEFCSSYYFIEKRFRSYTYREWRSYNDDKKRRETTFLVDDDTLVFEQLDELENPNEIIRSISIVENGKTKKEASFNKYVDYHHDGEINESFTATRDNKGIKRNRIITDSDNFIVSNYHEFGDEVLSGNVKSICSLYPPTIFTCTAPISSPDQIHVLDDYETPVIKISCSAFDTQSKKQEFFAELLIVKANKMLESLITYKDKDGENSFLTIMPSNNRYILPGDINDLINHFRKIRFLEFDIPFPLEKTLLEELEKLRIDIGIKAYSDFSTDLFENVLTQNIDYDHVAFQIYENLRSYYDKAKYAVKQNTEIKKK